MVQVSLKLYIFLTYMTAENIDFLANSSKDSDVVAECDVSNGGG